MAARADGPAPGEVPSQAAAPPTSTAELHTRSARRAARSHDCAAVELLGSRVRAVDPAYYTQVFVRDPDITACLRPRPPEPDVDRRHAGPGAKLGVGVGPVYGGFGLAAEGGLPHVVFVGGVGYLSQNIGWSVGIRGHVFGRFHWLRPHVTLLYGTTAVFTEQAMLAGI